MPTNINLISAIIQRKKDKISVEKSLGDNIKSDYVLQMWLDKGNKIEIKPFKKETGQKLVNVYIQIFKNQMQRASILFSSLFMDKRLFLIHTSGFCMRDHVDELEEIIENENLKKKARESSYKGCLWQGIIQIPEEMSITDLRNVIIQKLNEDLENKVLEEIIVNDVKIVD